MTRFQSFLTWLAGNNDTTTRGPQIRRLNAAQIAADRRALAALRIRLQDQAEAERCAAEAREARGCRVADGALQWIG